ncbi:MAG: hypothetical protein K2P76_14530 [Lachnospiraceae bacterium]|nr:hypothetical protein [Lachnospiraceae bacterium]
MGFVLEANNLNQIEKDTLLFKKGDRVSFIGWIIKGSIRVENHGVKRIAKAGEMIAISDVFADEYLGDYTTDEYTIFYAFPACDTESLQNFMSSNREYLGIIIDSVAKEFVNYLEEQEHLLNRAIELYLFLEKHYEIAVKSGMEEEVPEEFFKHHPRQMFELETEEHKIAYYREFNKIPLELKKEFYNRSSIMTLSQSEEASYIVHELQDSCMEIISYIKEIYFLFYNEKGSGLFEKEIRFAKELKKNGKLQMEQILHINDTKEKILIIINEIEKWTGEKIFEETEILENKLSSVMNASIVSSEEPEDDLEEETVEMLDSSLQQILDFSKTEPAEQEEIKKVFDDFVQISDKLSTQDDVRKLKKQITGYFFTLYKKCLFPWLENKSVPLAVKLFLNYGYMDERLLDRDQLGFLCERVNKKEEDLPFHIYTMPEWLREIYEGRKDTSRNSFEQDFRDYLREAKRTGDITGEQERQFLQDSEKRVEFEVDNMFNSNNKIVNGKLSTYVPVLYKDQFYGDLSRIFVSKRQLCETILELEKKDFTVFYREVFYSSQEMKIEKEYIMRKVYPDVIICPVYGTTSSMWQEITGKRRDSSARFIFPALMESELDKAVTKAFGRFHWEYCRCEQGASWNNIQYKSLTSEYMDYIQYYRKNHDLTEEKREKIRSQIQRARNNSREIFLSDYETWIYFESKSALKLNKVSRQIMATYCPFEKSMRDFLKTNVAFEQAMQAQQKKFSEKAKEWELRIRKRENSGLEVPEEFLETLSYYSNM